MGTEKIKLFYSYSHKDESLRDQLETQLAILARKGLIEEWHDRKILAGRDWELEIDNNLNEADVVLLLISPDFIASDYCYGKELSKAIERHETNQSIVIPIIVRPVEWGDASFAKLQALPKDAIAVTSWGNVDEAWLDVSQGIRDAIKNIEKNKLRRDDISGLKRVNSLLLNEADRIDQIFQNGDDQCGGVPTGLNDLDYLIDGLHRTAMIVLASRPGMGASDLAQYIASHIAINVGLPVAFFSFQLPANRLTQKLICSIANIDNHNWLRGILDDDDWVKITNALGKLNDAPLYIDESNVLSFSELADRIRSLKEKTGTLGLLVIDSIQNLAFQSNLPANEVSQFSKLLKSLSKELQTPIIVTSNVSNEVEQRPNKRPALKDLGEWRCFEEDADVIIFSYVDTLYNPDSPDRGTAELIVSKNAYGHVGTVRVIYSTQSFTFENLAMDSFPS